MDHAAKRFCQVFPEGKGFAGGPATLAEKLRSLCVSSSGPAVPVRKDSRSFADVVKAKGDRLGDAIWAHFGGPELRHREEQLGWCLVGRWGEDAAFIPDLFALRNWGINSWHLKRSRFPSCMGHFFCLSLRIVLKLKGCCREAPIGLERSF